MIKIEKKDLSSQKHLSPDLPDLDITKHSFDFIINRILVEVIDPLNLRELDDLQLENWKKEIKKNMRNELLENIS